MDWKTAVLSTVLLLQINIFLTACQDDNEMPDADAFPINSDSVAETVQDRSFVDGRTLRCNLRSPYRPIDGVCNNIENPRWATPGQPYGRFLENSYSDGVHRLPDIKSSPREISTLLFPDRNIEDPIWTLLTMQWGQTIAHDLSFTAGLLKEGDCCRNGQLTLREVTDRRCASIRIPEDDPVHGPLGDKCFNFYRTEATITGTPREPKTDVTGYMDASLVYGSSVSQARDLRSRRNGRLKSEMRNGQEWLPQSRNVRSTCFNVSSSREPCYRAGDSRVNQNPQLSVLQNILLREHNRIADFFCALDDMWDDEKCYQEARRILIAIIQNINYYEYLPIILGRENMIENELIFPDEQGYVNDYDPTVDPSVLNEFATGAFRNFHSNIAGFLGLFTTNRQTTGSIRLSDFLDKPSIIEQGDNFIQLALGLATQHQLNTDRFFTSEVTQFLFKMFEEVGQDLRARDIQRSRDHGVGTYGDALSACNLSRPTSFEDLEQYIPANMVSLLQQVYETVDQVELIVAGALETILPTQGALSGPTFQCIMTEQFRRTRQGDRFFYESENATNFTLPQLQSIRTVTIASILCNNVDGIDRIQPQAFLEISNWNRLVNCSEIPQVDLSLWKEFAG